MSYANNPWVKAFRLFMQQKKLLGKEKVKFIGEDNLGNKYFEESRPNSARKVHRYFLKPDINEKTNFVDIANVPPLWDAWLRFRRQDPPSPEEMKDNEDYFKFQQELAAKRRAERGLDPQPDQMANTMNQLKKPDRKMNPRPDVKTKRDKS